DSLRIFQGCFIVQLSRFLLALAQVTAGIVYRSRYFLSRFYSVSCGNILAQCIDYIIILPPACQRDIVVSL
ncbi:hypothetical protein, partial [Shuttleworthella sp. MSX8B]|uniref:hypothetical protein n=1 Tax=Shuttleworthella sp. MSX8B TaxID=936574 RepID=UPI001A98708B